MINGEGRSHRRRKSRRLCDGPGGDGIDGVSRAGLWAAPRCHDHKFDPLTQKDYYSLFSFFNNTPVTGDIGGGGQVALPVVDVATPEEKKACWRMLTQSSCSRAGVVMDIERTVFPPPTTQSATEPTTTASTQVASTQSSTTRLRRKAAGETTAAAQLPNEEYFAADSPKASELSGNVVASLRQFPQHRGPQYLNELAEHFKTSNPKYTAALIELRQAMEARQAAADRVPKVMVEEEMPTPRDAFVLVKGSYDKHTDKVTANTPTTLPSLPTDAKKDRLACWRSGCFRPSIRSRKAGGGQSLLAAILRRRPREDGRGFRLAGRAAEQSGFARLARGRVSGERMECQSARAADGDERGLSPIVQSHAGNV